jgi:transcriptional regulator with XRE-family HTH domain
MRDSKRKRLEAQGWRVGDAREFLGLTAEETAFIELKLRLADSLRERRLRGRLTQGQVAELIRSSQSRVAKMEAADPSVSVDLIIRSLFALGASKQDIAKAISRAARTQAALVSVLSAIPKFGSSIPHAACRIPHSSVASSLTL